ncbi:hypothetical protein O181_018018 [Austropuccinia psidii MF-1]|uniref:Uncharacterized protein n=1 Tax=Austropuccinia psidii MF-1 TaxID=1389203 RepID=A0A9Q3C888_9BASI|nr:hypothetical protein [Austropuccinia psidii MF-1]
MSPVHLRSHAIAGKKPEDRQGLFRAIRSGCGRILDCITLREIRPMLPFAFQFNRNLKTENWKDMDQVLKDLFQWSMANRSFSLASHWKQLEKALQKICLKEIPLKPLW